MPRKRTQKECGCGCGEMTAGGDFKPGHDSKTLSAILVRVGGMLKLKELIEEQTGTPIKTETNGPDPWIGFGHINRE